jgi:hypothetical protein
VGREEARVGCSLAGTVVQGKGERKAQETGKKGIIVLSVQGMA